MSLLGFHQALPFLVATVLAASCKCSGDERPRSRSALRFDGVYRSLGPSSPHPPVAYSYLRFTEQGIGCQLTTTKPVAIARAQLRCDTDAGAIAVGPFTFAGDHVRLVTELRRGKIEYDGQVEGDARRLRVQSHITGHAGEESYVFVADEP
ncbi:MAG: hypothetical protein HY744_28935 [Deltaproteobacteria bacterium]|nr:hypothetical protein [Deltaproteobacteria bacterium]